MNNITQLGQSQIYEDGSFYVIKYRLNQKLIDIQNQQLKHYTFDDFYKRGKYPQIKYSFSRKDQTFWMYLHKKYLLSVLNMKKYQLITYAKSISLILSDILQTMKNISKVQTNIFKVIHMDIISMTIYKQFETINYRNQKQVKKLYLRLSFIQFKRGPPPLPRSKQCDQYFSFVVRTSQCSQEGQMIDQNQNILPSNQQYYKSPRISFIDDLQSNQALFNKRIGRFFVFYQVYALYYGLIPIKHKLHRQFYQKCEYHSMVNSHRLKKFVFNFRITRIQKQKQKQNNISLVLNCLQQNETKTYLFQFQLQIFMDSQLAQKFKNIISHFQQNFIKQLIKSVDDYGNQSFITLAAYPNINSTSSKVFSFKNQLGFCQLLTEVSFFIDRLIYKSPQKQNPNQSTQGTSDDMILKIPPTQQFKSQKYAYHYCLQLRSCYNYQYHNPPQQQKQIYENTINKIIMTRSKLAKDNKDSSNKQKQSLQILILQDQLLKGLKIYLNQLLKKWNVRDCFQYLNCFASNYLNIVIDKNKQKNQKSYYKNIKTIKNILQGLNILIQVLTRSFSNDQTVPVFHILRTNQDKQDQILEVDTTQQQGQQIMLMTFKLMKLTTAGWIQIIPSCLFYFQMQKDSTYLYIQGQYRQNISLKQKKQKIQKMCKSYIDQMLKKIKRKIDLPPYFYK